MKHKQIYLYWTLAISLLPSAFADGPERVYKKAGNQSLYVASGPAIRKIKFRINIVDWRIDCSESRAVVWGQARSPTPVGVPPYAKVYTVDLNKMKILSSYSTTRGPHDAEFSLDRKRILIDEMLVDFQSGKFIENYNAEDLMFQRERCKDFEGRRLLQ